MIQGYDTQGMHAQKQRMIGAQVQIVQIRTRHYVELLATADSGSLY
jgi:hypothetical protein